MAELTTKNFRLKGINSRIIGRDLQYYTELASTMKTAAEAAKNGVSEGYTVIAGQQTAGRGRLERQWISPPGNVYLSVVLYPGVRLLPRLTMLAALAVAGGVAALTGLETQLKWPNDVLIRGRKVSGILLESRMIAGKKVTAIIGIGINANFNPADYPEIGDTATSLLVEAGSEISREDLVKAVLEEMDTLYAIPGAGEEVYRRWRACLDTIGKPVVVHSGSEDLYGFAEDVDKDGGLLVRLDDGSVSRVLAGDVSLRHRE